MNMSALVTFTMRKLNGYSRTEVAQLYDEVQLMIFSAPTELMRYRDPSTGQDPVLTTTAGTFEYELDAATIGVDTMLVGNVYDDGSSIIVAYDQMVNSSEIRASTKRGDSSTKAKVIFSEDPGDREYQVECYRYPTRITSPTVEPEIGEDLRLRFLYPGVTALVETFEHGALSEAQEKFERETIPLIRTELNKEGHTRVTLYKGDGF